MTGRDTSKGGSTALVHRIQRLLDDQRVAEAFTLASSPGDASAPIRNAQGVCLLRMERTDAAAKIFAALVFRGGISISQDTPVVFCTNYVTAVILENDFHLASDLLKNMPDRSHPAVQYLAAVLRRWRQSLPWWRRLLLPFGVSAGQAPRLDAPPGELWVPEV